MPIAALALRATPAARLQRHHQEFACVLHLDRSNQHEQQDYVERDRQWERSDQEAQRVADAMAFLIDAGFVVVDAGRGHGALPAHHYSAKREGEHGDRDGGKDDYRE